jgi:hypothetical protein
VTGQLENRRAVSKRPVATGGYFRWGWCNCLKWRKERFVSTVQDTWWPRFRLRATHVGLGVGAISISGLLINQIDGPRKRRKSERTHPGLGLFSPGPKVTRLTIRQARPLSNRGGKGDSELGEDGVE